MSILYLSQTGWQVCNYAKHRSSHSHFVSRVDPRKKDLDADFDREFLQELRELKFLANEKDASDQHKRFGLNFTLQPCDQLNKYKKNRKNTLKSAIQ